MLTEQLLAIAKTGKPAEMEQAYSSGVLAGITDAEKNALTRRAALGGNTAMLRYLFEHHHLAAAEPDEHHRTLLHWAAMSGNADAVAYATDVLGFDIMAGDDQGKTALDYAAGASDPGAIQWLEDKVGFSLADCCKNPIRSGFHPDPSIVRVGNDYYMVNSTFVHFPGLPISHSTDLLHWTTIGHAVEDLESSGLAGLPGGYGYWAPDISYHKGRFWVVATLRRDTAPVRVQMITSASDPRGPWEKPRFLEADGIDPSLFTDEDGKRYLLVNPGATLIELSDEGELIGEPQMLYYGSARIKTEGPHLLKHNGWYYLFQAEGGTGQGHMETVARSRSLRGPYAPCPFNPILGRRDPNAMIQRSGHGKPVMTPDGRWFMVYLCGRSVEGKTVMGRETAIDAMTWTADDWPMVNHLKGPSCLLLKPFPDQPGNQTRDEEWTSPRSNPAGFAQVREETIRLTCGADPASLAPCSLLLRRQTEANFTQKVTVDMTDAADGATAGLMGYYDERSFFLYGLRHRSGSCELVLREHYGAEERESILMTDAAMRVGLRIEGSALLRKAGWSAEDKWAPVTEFEAGYLSDEGVKGGKRFTGATVGLAAVGAGSVLFTGYEDEMWE